MHDFFKITNNFFLKKSIIYSFILYVDHVIKFIRQALAKKFINKLKKITKCLIYSLPIIYHPRDLLLKLFKVQLSKVVFVPTPPKQSNISW